MKIFVTGGTGSLGKHIVKKLEKSSYDLLLLSRKPRKHSVKTVQGNLSDIKKWGSLVKRFKPQAAIHIAWEDLPDYGVAVSIKNLRLGLDLFNFLAEIKCKKIISTGSCWEYGPQTGKLSEDMTIAPMNAFTAAKNSLNWLGQEIAKEHGVQFIWTRIFYVYGPGLRQTSLVQYLISCARDGKVSEIKNPAGKNDLVYVEDVAEAILMLLKKCHKQNAIYNIGSGRLTSVQRVIEVIAENYGLEPQYRQLGPQPSDVIPINFYADISKIKKEIGWKPKTGIREGIKRTISYYKNLEDTT